MSKKSEKIWETTDMGNELLGYDDFYISYRANTNSFGSMFVGDDGGVGETAVCYDDNFMILNGDFRKDYEELAKQGLDKCLEFYNSKKTENASMWSDD